MLLVDRGALPVKVRLVLVRVEDLNLVLPHEINAAIATPLPSTDHLLRRGEFEVELAVPERVLGGDPVLVRDGVSVLNDPLVATVPLRQVLAVEKHDGVGRRTALLPRGDDVRLRPD